MSKRNVVVAIACFAAAVVIFVFGEGDRRLYSGIFFVVLGGVLLVNAWRSRRQSKE